MAEYKWQFLEMPSSDKFNDFLRFTISTVLFGVFLSWVWSRRKLYAVSMKLDGPIAFPFLGCVTCLYRLPWSNDPMEILHRMIRKYSGIVRLWIGPELVVLVYKPEDVESVMKSRQLSAKPPLVYKMWVDSSGNGILTSFGIDSLWKNHRRIISSAFCSSTLLSYQHAVQRQAVLLLRDLEQFCGLESVDYEIVISRFVADFTSDSLFDYKTEFREGKEDVIIHAPDWIAISIYNRMVNFWNVLDIVYKFCPERKKQVNCTKVARDYCIQIHDEKIQTYTTLKGPNKKSPGIMDVLLDAENQGKLTKNEVIEEMMNLWGASVDTVNKNILIIILMLAMHKECQDKAFREIREYYKDDRDAPVEKDHLQHFTYLDMCIKEVLRIFPATVVNLRYVTEELVMRNGTVIPPKTSVALMMMMSHRDPEVWPDSDSFIPERFAPEEVARRHPWAYYPFSGGLRNCIGQKFAGVGARTSLVYILRKFEVHSDWKLKDMPPAYDVSVHSPWGYKARFTERKW